MRSIAANFPNLVSTQCNLYPANKNLQSFTRLVCLVHRRYRCTRNNQFNQSIQPHRQEGQFHFRLGKSPSSPLYDTKKCIMSNIVKRAAIPAVSPEKFKSIVAPHAMLLRKIAVYRDYK
jgi:hypothetical protein